MTEPAHPLRWEVQIRACCGNLRWALLEAIESLPAGAHVGALRWGPAEIPVDVEVGDGPPDRAAQALLDAARRRLGPGSSCYAGRGALVVAAARPARRDGAGTMPVSGPGIPGQDRWREDHFVSDERLAEEKGGICDGVP